MGFNTSSVWIKVALICLALGTLLFVIGFATTSWMVTKEHRLMRTRDHYGLWNRKLCRYDNCETHDIDSYYLRHFHWTDWYRATQAFECIGLICIAMALLIIFLFIFVDGMRKRSALIAIIVFSFCAVAAMVIGFLIFGLKFDELIGLSVGWSMGLAIAGSIFAFIAGVMAVIDLKK